MTGLNLDDRLRLPYSIATGMPKGGDAEIEGYLQSLRVQGFCVVERVTPEGEISTVRESVHRGSRLFVGVLQESKYSTRSARTLLKWATRVGCGTNYPRTRYASWGWRLTMATGGLIR